MTAISFSVFKDKIISGKKRQTIRKVRKNPIREGMDLELYWWQRSPNNEFLGKTTCLKVTEITIHRNHIDYLDSRGYKSRISSVYGLLNFALNDGFSNWDELVTFFVDTHGLPFTGSLIEWDYPLELP